MIALLYLVLAFNLLMESMAAATLIGGPAGLAAAGSGEQWSMHYGFAALAIASVSLWALPFRKDYAVLTCALGVLLTFHVGLCASLIIAGDQVVGSILHGVLASLCLICFLLRRQLISA